MKRFVVVSLLSCVIGHVWCDTDSVDEKLDAVKPAQSWVFNCIKNQQNWRNAAGDWRSFCLARQSDAQFVANELGVQHYAEDSFAKGAIKGGQNSLVAGGLLALPVLRTRLAAPAFFFGAALSGAYTFAKCGSIDEPCAQRMSYYSKFDPKDAQGLSSISEVEQGRYLNGQVVGGLALTGLLATRMFRQAPRFLRAVLFGVGR